MDYAINHPDVWVSALSVFLGTLTAFVQSLSEIREIKRRLSAIETSLGIEDASS